MDSIHNIDLSFPFCPKTTVSDLPHLKFNTINGLKILYLNARSVNMPDKIDEIEHIIHSTKTTIHIIAITETWLSKESEKYVSIKNYTPIFCSRPNKPAGGVAIFIRNEIQNFEIATSFSDDRDSILSVHIKFRQKSLNLICIYRKPNGLIDEVKCFLDTLEKFLTDSSKDTLIVGDFNFNLKLKDESIINEYINVLQRNNFYICNNSTITRLASNSVLDHVITNNIAQNVALTYVDNDHFDHRIIFVELNELRPIINTNLNQYKTENIDVNKLNNSLIKSPIQLNQSTNVNEMYKEYSDQLDKMVKSAKIILKNKSKINTAIKPWINEDVLNSINSKNFWFNKMKINEQNHLRNPQEKLIEELKLEYNYWKNRTTHLKNENRIRYFSNKFEKNKNNHLKTWKTINEAMYNGKTKPNVNISIKIPNSSNLTSTDTESAELLNKYFANVGQVMASQFNSNYNFVNMSTSPTITEFIPITETGTEIIVRNLNNTSSSGFNNISVKTVKKCLNNIITPLTQLINKSLRDGIFPQALKTSKVIPIFKTGDKNEPSNFRPISLSPYESKIIEKSAKYQLIEFIEENDLLYKRQYGFRSKRNTNIALLDFMSETQDHLDKSRKVGAVFIDLSKAFDTVDINILTHKIELLGIRGTALNWCKSYLMDRNQFVSINNERSQTLPINYGVPQGSVLGPLFFLIYINSIKDIGLNGSVFMYADDIVLLFNCENYDELETSMNIDLAKLNKWSHDLKLSVNINKTKYMIFNTDSAYSMNILYNSVPVEKVLRYKHLGFILDYKLDWGDHISTLKKRISPVAGVFRKIQKLIPSSTKRSLFYSFFNSHITYGSMFWGTAPKYKVKQIQVLQNKAIRNLFGYPFRFSTRQMHFQEDILTIENQFIKISTTTINQIINQSVNSSINLQKNSDAHSYTTRNADALLIKTSKTWKFGINSALTRALNEYNNLPNYFKTLNNTKFKNKLSQYLKNK